MNDFEPAPPIEAYTDLARANHAAQRPPMHLMSYTDMEAMPAPEWLVEGLLQRRATGLMFGKSNSFKSFLAIDIGLSVATGRAWHGNEVRRGNVLFVATEGAIGVGKFRIPAWYEHHDVHSKDRNRAFLYPQEIRIDNPEDITDLITAMRKIGRFELVILDIFGGTMAGSEVEDKTARAWVNGVQRILRETGSSVFTVAHTGWQDDSRARMHTHFWGSFDSRMRVDGDKESLTTTLAIERHKDADSTGKWGFRLVPAASSLVPELDGSVSVAKGRPKLSASDKTALTSLDDALTETGEIKTGADWPTCKVVKLEAWRKHFYRHCDAETPDAKRQAFSRARKSLHKNGTIQFFDDHFWRCFD